MASCNQNAGCHNQEQPAAEIKIDISKLVDQIQAQKSNGDVAGESPSCGSGGVVESSQRRRDHISGPPEKRTIKELAASAGKKLFGNSSSK
ncbi:hypothetical protein LIER_07533 [Lithospermum erythrorhizon]|uniref:Uncharacterized protein n=1 Tax=Lithospermum erythrorhizon TaxID=34254 RepID=A0AAV3P9J4_LITER